MKLVTGQEMKLLDRQAIESYGIPGIVLMENAGMRAVEAIADLFQGELAGKRIFIFAGKGNNGGDGFVIARHLVNAGADVKVFMTCRPEELQGDAQINYEILLQMQVKIHTIFTTKDLQRVDIALTYGDLVVDALFGTGFKGALSGVIADLVNLLNSSRKPILAVDIPSGLEADTGQVNGPCVRATCTVTFGFLKVGLCVEPGAQYTGRLWLGDISFPRKLYDEAAVNKFLINHEQAADWLPARDPGGHKGTFGHVLVVGGSEGMTGAVTLASQAALRAGAGVVTAAVPRSLNQIMEIKTTEVMTKPLPETDDHTISPEALPGLLSLAKKMDAVVIGPGISRNPNTFSLVKNFLSKLTKPVVVDADGLSALAEEPGFISALQAPVVLTPHPGEMARLLGVSVKEVQADRLNLARSCAEKWKAVVVLKGAKTVVAAPDGTIYLNVTGNSGMGTAGSGDVLAGMVGSLLAQGLTPLEASACAVYCHGLAGDRGAESIGKMALTAGDLLGYLPQVLKELEDFKEIKRPVTRRRLIRIF